LELKFINKFRGTNGSSNGDLNDPQGIRIHYPDYKNGNSNATIDDDFEIYIADKNNHRVQVWNGKTGAWIRNYGINNGGNGNGELKQPFDIELVGNELFVLEFGNHRISVFNLKSGDFIRHISGYGSNDDQLNLPKAMTLFTNNQLFIADYNHCKIKVFNTTQ